MDSRRDFLKKVALLAAGGGLTDVFPASIHRALAIDPAPGTTYQDAEHVVILMQENRSFDHCYGSLRGVRGFNDPRAMTLPNGNPVWLQTNAAGETYAPFRLNIKDTKATWMGSLPHTWTDQSEARNGGKYDRWLDAKASRLNEYAHLPLTLGFYNRDDLPYYYALADAFTICDQAFCSSLTGTTPNRLHLWTGTIREKPSILSKAHVRNEDVGYNSEVKWKTFPERLEEAGVSWRVYQNEVSLPSGLENEAEIWLSNFTDNPLEWFTQYHVRFIYYRRQLAASEKALKAQLKALQTQGQPHSLEQRKQMADIKSQLEKIQVDQSAWTEDNFAKLPVREQNLHRKAFTTNEGDPHYRELESFTYQEGAAERRMQIPKGDVLHQFREDVRNGKLPAVSWIVAPENFSDHPDVPWYGTWYVSEIIDILTQNPEVWKKTIFILCYDENDGQFDHVPPFVPPYPNRPESGIVSAGIDTSVEHVRWEQEQEYRREYPGATVRAGPIGLGYRVPMVIASPWSRGGRVCSQIFDHTSILQFLEKFATHKTGRPVRETNISDWRRTVCGDLTSVFQPFHEEKINPPTPLERKAVLGSIHQAQFKQIPSGFKKLSASEIERTRKSPRDVPWLPQQEEGVRPACALPYELRVDGALSADRNAFAISFAAGKERFGERAAGAPFHVYAPVKARGGSQDPSKYEIGRTWDYAVVAGDRLSYSWPLKEFEDGYHLRVQGPNGFYREFRGTKDDPAIEIKLVHPVGTSPSPIDAEFILVNRDPQHSWIVSIDDMAYGSGVKKVSLDKAGAANSTAHLTFELTRSFGWHDWRVKVENSPRFEQRYAGRVESGKDGFSDPCMGRVSL